MAFIFHVCTVREPCFRRWICNAADRLWISTDCKSNVSFCSKRIRVPSPDSTIRYRVFANERGHRESLFTRRMKTCVALFAGHYLPGNKISWRLFKINSYRQCPALDSSINSLGYEPALAACFVRYVTRCVLDLRYIINRIFLVQQSLIVCSTLCFLVALIQWLEYVPSQSHSSIYSHYHCHDYYKYTNLLQISVTKINTRTPVPSENLR